MTKNAPVIQAHGIDWVPVGAIHNDDDPLCKLKAKSFKIADVNMHLEAIAVNSDTTESDAEEAPQEGADGVEDAYAELSTFAGGDGSLETVKIGDRHYVIYAIPFAN